VVVVVVDLNGAREELSVYITDVGDVDFFGSLEAKVDSSEATTRLVLGFSKTVESTLALGDVEIETVHHGLHTSLLSCGTLFALLLGGCAAEVGQEFRTLLLWNLDLGHARARVV
jgi:hypothetical protein